jgi:glycosyltransferase involved in cell wall biosynthesis
MKFSVITPTNSNSFLDELHESILSQTYENWEWILYLNGNLTIDDISEQIKNNEKVKIFIDIPCDKSSNVGYLKNKAFHLGDGDVLVEVDHDDIITSDCLHELHNAYSNNDVGFVYSDSAVLSDNFVDYDVSLGWEFYDYDFKGISCRVPKSFEPSAASLSTIWWAPDHVRSWKRDVYLEVGGHNPELSILDDHELMIKTYLNTKFHYIPSPLYIYRVHEKNTWLERNEKIQIETVELFHQWAESLAERDAHLNKLFKIEISNNDDHKNGYVTVGESDSGMYWDMNSKLPFEDNTVGVIRLHHTLPLIKLNPVLFMNEVHRVLADGGWVFIEVPSTDGRGAWQDPTHITRWNENSFWYYTDSNFSKFISNASYRFQNFFTKTIFPSDWWKENNIPVVKAQLRAIKSQRRRPNKILI